VDHDEGAAEGLVARPGVASVIPGATTPQQVRSNVDAARWELTGPDLVEVDRLTTSLDAASTHAA
jgi:aryl-alcohol dehydrogenase-like predicted oxidoreductase